MAISYTLVVGDTLSFTTPAPTGEGGVVYRPGDGWSLTYRLIPRSSSGSAITLNATAADADTYAIGVPAATTAGYAPGWYSVAAWVTKGADTYTVEPLFEQAEIKPNPRTQAAGYDGRTAARKALDDARAALAAAAARMGSADSGRVIEYAIGDRRFRYDNAEQAVLALRSMIAQLEIEVQRESRAEAIRRGLASPRHVYTRLGRV